MVSYERQSGASKLMDATNNFSNFLSLNFSHSTSSTCDNPTTFVFVTNKAHPTYHGYVALIGNVHEHLPLQHPWLYMSIKETTVSLRRQSIPNPQLLIHKQNSSPQAPLPQYTHSVLSLKISRRKLFLCSHPRLHISVVPLMLIQVQHLGASEMPRIPILCHHARWKLIT